MARANTVSLVNSLNRMYRQSEAGYAAADTELARVFWLTRKYDCAWVLASLTDDDQWWSQYDTDLTALQTHLSV